MRGEDVDRRDSAEASSKPSAATLLRSEPPAIFHDHFSIRGGGERLVLTLAEGLGADLFHGYATPDTYEAAMFPERTFALGLPRPLRRGGMRPIALSYQFARQRERASTYRTRIFSGVAALFAAPERSKVGRNIFYSHTPPRFVFDQRDHFLRQLPRPARLAAGPILARFERAYRAAVGRMDLVLTNSENTRRRIRDYLGHDSIVVHPPVDTEAFRWSEPRGYYLSSARLTPLKRVGTIIDAFLKMPSKQLVVASGGDQEDALRARAAGAANIRFAGWTSDSQLQALVAGAIATIYVPIDEDFGMSPVESMAAGKPVIGVAEGGLLETIVPRETGLLLPPGFGADDLAEAVMGMDNERARSMRAACEARARLFTREAFLRTMRRIVDAP